MKLKSIITIFLISALAFACGQAEEGLDAKKSALTDARAELKALESQISTLESEIKAEDPDFEKISVNKTLVTVVSAEKKSFEHKIEVRGNVESRENVNISAEMMGQLVELKVREGQTVRAGQLIAAIDSENLIKTIDEVETQLEFATTVFEKRKNLWEKNIGTEIEYLQSKNNKEALENQLETLTTQLDKSTIEAPFSGIIESVPVKNGQIIQPGQPVAFLVSNNNMYITAEVSERYIGNFRVGDEVEVSLPAVKETFMSKINSVGNVINPSSRTFSVDVELPDGKDYLKTNLIAVLKLTDYHAKQAVVIPSRIIQEDLEGNFVYLADKEKARKVHVELGLSYNNRTEVVAGLNGGEPIIDKGNRSVADGTVIDLKN